MALEQDLYNAAGKLERATQTLKDSAISKQDKKDILEYNEGMSALGISERRMLKNVYSQPIKFFG